MYVGTGPPTVVRMKSGLKRTPSPHSLISSAVGSFLDIKAVMDSLLPPLTIALKSSTMLPFFVSSKGRTKPQSWCYKRQTSTESKIFNQRSHLPSHLEGHHSFHLGLPMIHKFLLCSPQFSFLPVRSSCSLLKNNLETSNAERDYRYLYFTAQTCPNTVWTLSQTSFKEHLMRLQPDFSSFSLFRMMVCS